MQIVKCAVIGSGTMGAQIAAHLVNAGLAVDLFDLIKDKQLLAAAALPRLLKTDPPALATPDFLRFITPRSLEQDLEALRDCSLIIEAIPEELSLKTALFKKIAPFISAEACLATNTSGLSITQLAKSLPAALQARFVGMHFFNPPRYLPLVELIPHAGTRPALLDHLETFLVATLGKEVVRARDTPNFIANRLGVFGLLMTLKHAQALNLPLEVVDELTGPLIGRPKSATCRTLDLVGLDVLSHVVATMGETLPAWLTQLIKAGALGAKTQKGIYQKTKDGLLVWDIATETYRSAEKKANPAFVGQLKKRKLSGIWPTLAADPQPEAQFLYRLFCDFFDYAGKHLDEIVGSCLEVDRALKAGFAWKQGLFELWQAVGYPDYPEGRDEVPLHLFLPVYARHMRPNAPVVAFENQSAVAWVHEEALILSFKTKLCTIDDGVLEALGQAREIAEKQYKGLILWQKDSEHFSAGADLMNLAEKFMTGGPAALEAILVHFQNTVLSMRYAKVPVVAAVQGYVLGGGCELAMHTHKVVAALDTYMGLVEVGVGIVPGACGSKEMARRASLAQHPQAKLLQYFKQIGQAEVAKSAYQAQEMDYLRETDVIILDAQSLLHVALQELNALAARPFCSPRPEKISAQGLPALGNMLGMLTQLQVGQFASTYDSEIATGLAEILTGGRIDPAEVDEAWFLRLERETFLRLVQNEKTQARVQFMLEHGKPLRN